MKTHALMRSASTGISVKVTFSLRIFANLCGSYLYVIAMISHHYDQIQLACKLTLRVFVLFVHSIYIYTL